VLARSAARELAWGLPAVSREVHRWQARARSIPDQPLREDALSALRRKRGQTDGAALFSILPAARSLPLLRLLVAYQIMWDFLDSVHERAAEPKNGVQLHTALVDALDPTRAPRDYYMHHPWKHDGGYLSELVRVCRENCLRLPGFPAVAPLIATEATRAEVLALNHEPDPLARDALLKAWARREFAEATEVTWWELSGAASAGLTIFALLALAADGNTTTQLLTRTRAVYSPWTTAAATMLDSYVDRVEDELNGDHSYVAHYPTQETAVAYLQQRVVGLLWGLRRPEDGMALVTRAMEWWDEPDWRRRLTPLRVRGLATTRGSRIAAEVSGEALADEALEPEVRRQVEVVHAVHLFGAGRVRRACELIARLRPPIPLRDEIDELAMMACSVAGIESGWAIEEAERWMGRAFREAIRTYDEAAAGISASTLGAMCMLRGRYVDAARWLREALVHLEYHDPFATLKCSHALLAGIAYYLGDQEGVAAAMERCRAAITSELIDQERAYVVRGEAWLALAQGDPPRAQRMLLECAQGYTEVPPHAAELYHEAMRAGTPARVVHPPLAALREECDGRLVVAYIDDAAARAARDGTAVLACADEFEAIGALRHASECAAAAADIFIEAGRQDSARRAVARSRELHGHCQGGFAPTVRGLEPDSYSLTERERQLVELAGQGLSNAEIADRFVLSVRTVESHLYRAMQKLGVKDRRDLRARVR